MTKSTFEMVVPDGAASVMDALVSAGFEAYLVGGCVRDAFLGRSPHDFDITTSATPEEMVASVPFPHYDTGLAHGTITFLVDGEPYEVTTFRADGDYSDGRHPDEVVFVRDAREDLARRDFTMNAMAYSPVSGLVDPFGGADDAAAGVVRAVGDARERFREDGLRVMRAIRFAAVFGFSVEKDTAEAIHECRSMLSCVSVERICVELMKLLGADDGCSVSAVLREFRDVLFTVVPELAESDGYDQNNSHHDRDLFEHLLSTVEGVRNDPVLRLAALLHDAGKPVSVEVGEDGQAHYFGHMDAGRDIAEAVCSRLKMSNDDSTRVVALVSKHDFRPFPTKKAARRFVARCGSAEMVDDMLDLMYADINAHAPESVAAAGSRLAKSEEVIRSEMAADACFKVKDLKVGGKDVLALGFAPGPVVGDMLDALFADVMSGVCDNDRDVLLARLAEVAEKYR